MRVLINHLSLHIACGAWFSVQFTLVSYDSDTPHHSHPYPSPLTPPPLTTHTPTPHHSHPHPSPHTPTPHHSHPHPSPLTPPPLTTHTPTPHHSHPHPSTPYSVVPDVHSGHCYCVPHLWHSPSPEPHPLSSCGCPGLGEEEKSATS